MKRSLKITIMVLAVIFVILYAARQLNSEDAKVNTEEVAAAKRMLPEEEQNLEKYRQRFARNTYHLEKALESIKELEKVLDTVNTPLDGDPAINLRILHHRSVVHLEEIIKSIKTYEEYPNFSEQNLLDEAIVQLRRIDDEIIGDSLDNNDIYEAFDFTLNALAKAELNISKSAFKTDQVELAVLALKQAQVHIKNAFLLDFSVQPYGSAHYNMEVQVFKELDSLIEYELLPIHELDSRLTKISTELDTLLQMRQQSN